jgi:NAD+ diphosphatase
MGPFRVFIFVVPAPGMGVRELNSRKNMNELGFWILRYNNQVLITTTGDNIVENIFPYGRASDFCDTQNVLLAGEWSGIPCYTADIDQLPEKQPFELIAVRRLFGLAGAEAFALVGRATQLLDWQNNHRYCGKCGRPTTRKNGEFAMSCSACGLLFYPRIAPAVMVLVLRDDEVLLARSPHFTPGVFSALAGFVEAGETLEECAIREVREEVGIEITNLRYFRSQSWPFPNSLMVAFTADYVSGILTPDPSEIEAANWFLRGALPPLPDPVSISRQLIDAVCDL